MAKKKQIDKKMGLYFKKARIDQKLTYEEFAEMSGISSMIIPVLFEPSVRSLRATIPENRSH